jgi:6-phosphogluconolactonase (cycloisomerase 2 family)
MYQVNATTGAFAEVPNSPFASANTNEPVFIAVEPSGKYIAVVNRASPNAGQGSIETFQIDSANLALVPVVGSLQELDSTVIGAGINHLNRRFYVFLAPNPNNPAIQMDSELNNYGIDPQTGFVSGNSFLVGSEGRCFTMDPQGRFLVVGIGRIEGIIGILPIAADTGIPGGTFVETSLGLGSFPNEISTEVTGSFIYLTYLNGTNPPVHIFAIDPPTQLLTETASSPLPGFTSVPALMLDPTGPFMYQSDATGTSVQAFQIDPLTGYFTAVAGTTISAPGANGSYVFSIVPGQQNLVGPQASLTPAALSLGNITVGTASPAQPIVLTSTGDQALSLTSISIGGANGVLVVMVTCAAASLGGCGGGSSGALVTPTPVITPAGTSTIVITPTAMSATGQPLQLPPIQLTLTVN